jgi:histidine phosphotransferase ChpT
LAPAVADLLAGSPAQAVDAHTIQPLYTGILARDCGLRVSAALEGDVVVLVAR